jgi:hypothetical protein
MTYIASPFEFQDNDSRDKWLQKFRDSMNDICIKYKVPHLLDQIKLDIADGKVGIISMGASVGGSGEERATREILKVYNDSFWN